MKRSAAFLLCSALFLAGCASQKKPDVLTFDSAPLFGMIYDLDNQPCSGVTLRVDDLEGPLSDIRGRFVLPDLARGEHALSARKQGYEPLRITISFLNRTDVLHLQMISFNQLLARAEVALAQLRWSDARAYLERAQGLDTDNPVLSYMFAILDFRTGDCSSAVERLTSLLTRSKQASIYLLLADIYETGLNDPQKAVESLQSALKLREDAEVGKRLEALKEKMAKLD